MVTPPPPPLPSPPPDAVAAPGPPVDAVAAPRSNTPAAGPEIEIGSTVIGGTRPAYVIAEAGVNHNGSVSLAHRLVAAAADAGADAVKFQTFDPGCLAVAGARTAAYQQDRTGLDDQRAMLAGLTLPAEAWDELRHDAAERGIEFLSTPFDERSLDALLTVGIRAVKISSGDLTNHRLLRAAGRTGLPVLLSTGASHLAEVADAVDALADAVAEAAPRLAIFHCVTAYPAPVEASNLRTLAVLADSFRCPVGWSDHTIGATSAVAATALGAKLFEKHLTLDRDLDGPDHRASADPDDLAAYLAAIRATESALGSGVKEPQPVERDTRPVARRSLYLTRDLPAGSVLAPSDVIALRPEAGLPASADVTGHTTTRDLRSGTPLQAIDLTPSVATPATPITPSPSDDLSLHL